jgi:hypothetical protein
MYSVYQHWDPLAVCIVGKSYPPEFYDFITNSRVRNVLERIAIETEEDYQKLIKLLESFDVQVLRPKILDRSHYLGMDNKYLPPPMSPRDYAITIGNDFYFKTNQYTDWQNAAWGDVIDCISPHVNLITSGADFLTGLNSASNTRVGKDIYLGTDEYGQNISGFQEGMQKLYPNYRFHKVDTGGHSDATFCPVVPGLIISLQDIPTYADTFPGWQVVYLPGQSWDQVRPFLKLKNRNRGKWWVPGEELNDEFTDFVESWLNHWVGYVEETVFDVNMLVINEKNVVCSNYNKTVFDAFERFGITPHVVNFRHRYFWDGGLHCITVDVARNGTLNNYFPERG